MTDSDKPGLKCPRCHCADLRVYRTKPGDGCVVRIRECRNCGKRKIITRERPAFAPEVPISPALEAARGLLRAFPQHVIVWEVGHPIAPNGYLYDARRIRCKTVDWRTMHAMQAEGFLEFIGQPELSGISERTYYHSSAYRVTPALPILDGIPAR